jgi:hypothetical protein
MIAKQNKGVGRNIFYTDYSVTDPASSLQPPNREGIPQHHIVITRLDRQHPCEENAKTRMKEQRQAITDIKHGGPAKKRNRISHLLPSLDYYRGIRV